MFWRRKKEAIQSSQRAATMQASLTVQVVVKTDLGNIRTNNEDAVLFKKSEDGQKGKGMMMLVADGMGGHLAGEVASNMAVESISESYFHHSNGSNVSEALKQAFVRANRKILDSASFHEQYKGMGTTCTVLVLEGNKLFYAHAGDSRAYHFRNGILTQITTDHTYVQELVNNGSISLEDAETHPQRNILTNAMGTRPELKVDSAQFDTELAAGDRLLVCSDGLYDYFNAKELEQILSGEPLHNVADFLLSEAKRRGGHDNISFILARVGGNESDPQTGKETRDADQIKHTRDAQVPLNMINHDRSTNS